MTPEQKVLYGRIFRFELDCPSALFPFSAKLAWEYRWSGVYTHRAIQEYKKFVFLVTIADQPLSPSTAIDRVWHYHLLYTHSYWDEFCGKILQRPLHHSPSSGEPEMGIEYYHQYCKTIELYRSYFGMPPEDIWNFPRLKTEHASFQWVDRRRYWLMRKLNWGAIAQKYLSP